MAAVKQLSGETILAMIEGTKITSFFSKVSTKMILTNIRVYQETTSGAYKESSIIPLRNVDSFGLMTSSKPWLLVLGAIIILCGLYSLETNSSKSDALIILIIGVIPIVLWWFTRKIGAVVYSLSGETKLSVLASAGNLEDIINFIARIQEATENNDAGLDKSTHQKDDIDPEYISMKGTMGAAICSKCKATGPIDKFYYHQKTNTYYHKECIPNKDK